MAGEGRDWVMGSPLAVQRTGDRAVALRTASKIGCGRRLRNRWEYVSDDHAIAGGAAGSCWADCHFLENRGRTQVNKRSPCTRPGVRMQVCICTTAGRSFLPI